MVAIYEHDRRVVIYPAYLDKNKTEKEGRRIPKELAVDGPLFPEIAKACAELKFPVEFEKKTYPRGSMMEFGRIRVQLKNDLNQPLNDQIATRRQLLLKVAERIREEPSRVKRGGKPPVLVLTPQGFAMMEPKDAEAFELRRIKEIQEQQKAAMAQAGLPAGMAGGAGPSMPNMKKVIKKARK